MFCMLHIKELQAVLTTQASQTEGRLHTLICSKQEVHMLQVVTAEYDLKSTSSATYFSLISIKKSKVWCVCVKAAITFRSSRLHKSALLSLSLEFTHNFRTALWIKWIELIYQNYFQCLFSFNVFFWGFSSWLTWDLFPLEPVLWCQPFYYSRFTSSSESRGGGTASSLLLHLVSSSSSSHSSADVSAVLPQRDLFISSQFLKQTAAKIRDPSPKSHNKSTDPNYHCNATGIKPGALGRRGGCTQCHWDSD